MKSGIGRRFPTGVLRIGVRVKQSDVGSGGVDMRSAGLLLSLAQSRHTALGLHCFCLALSGFPALFRMVTHISPDPSPDWSPRSHSVSNNPGTLALTRITAETAYLRIRAGHTPQPLCTGAKYLLDLQPLPILLPALRPPFEALQFHTNAFFKLA